MRRVVAELLIGEGLKGDTVAVPVRADEHREPAEAVTRGDDAAVGAHEQDGHGPVDVALGVQDAVGKGLALVDEGGDKLRHVDFAGAHGHELVAVVGKIGPHQLLGIVDLADGGDGVNPEVGAHQQRLGIGVADAADAARALEVRQILFKAGAEGGVCDGVDLPVKAVFPAPDRHPGVAGAEMAVVVGAEEDIQDHVAPGDGAEETAHYAKKRRESVIGSTYSPSL